MRAIIHQLCALVVVLVGTHPATAKTEALVSSPGDTAIVPGWRLQSVTRVDGDLSTLSKPGAQLDTWYSVSSRGTVMSGLIQNGVYKEEEIFFSNHMDKIGGQAIFEAPWIYRRELTLHPKSENYFTLKTHGITSKADIWVNGALVASSEEQQGSYGGHACDLTNHVKEGINCVLIQAYPTNYLRDFAMGFVDWNPYPADNGTGVWRNVELSQTGAVSMSPFRVITDFTQPGMGDTVNVTLRTKLINHASNPVNVIIKARIHCPDGNEEGSITHTLKLEAGEQKTASVEASIHNPQIWWPARWGPQPLYTVQAGIFTGNGEAFSVNGHSFQVLGAGYSSDMFMRFDEKRVEKMFQYVIDMGLNTVRLEGKQEHPELGKVGIIILMLMVLNGGESDYPIARASMLHEAEMMQAHPSMLGFLVGSDYWPNDHATKIYLDALKELDWRNPVIASASMRGFPEALGPSGMKMNGPYDWVPPNYWYGEDEGAAFGFGSELGAGVGTPEMESLRKFLSQHDIEQLWKEPNVGLYHMSSNVSAFHDRKIYNEGLFSRYGEPTSIDDYITKCQMADYEATRAQFEAYSAPPGLICIGNSSTTISVPWGAYFGTRVGTREEHVAYDYESESVWLINHSLETEGDREITIDLIDTNGNEISSAKAKTWTNSLSSKEVQGVRGIEKVKDVAFLRLALYDGKENTIPLSRNVYWLSPKPDVLDWSNSNWYYTPVTTYADFSKLKHMAPAIVKASLQENKATNGWRSVEILLENKSEVPAVFIRLHALKSDGTEIAPILWSDNYVTLWPKEKMFLRASFEGDLQNITVELSGRNLEKQVVEGMK
ncbi:Glycoside hydrolase family 2 N-terminal [Penicillium maclennaniae]|uniref:Glycoside hydrolase family 2 N-terminal n=1 Tax=Penicillium maclennaniae TaxID=1343394 RepID=UPI002540EF8C|nr:Glycoside hydrolase family 2 N-terminal [Penicillium maclennaniae]KAJ5667697.1 Glycoside hydrolase family 2 N-terminal [Penicillium maclennaniae]